MKTAAAVHRDPDDRLCADCSADEFVCARQASNGGRVCCPACSHVKVRRVTR